MIPTNQPNKYPISKPLGLCTQSPSGECRTTEYHPMCTCTQQAERPVSYASHASVNYTNTGHTTAGGVPGKSCGRHVVINLIGICMSRTNTSPWRFTQTKGELTRTDTTHNSYFLLAHFKRRIYSEIQFLLPC